MEVAWRGETDKQRKRKRRASSSRQTKSCFSSFFFPFETSQLSPLRSPQIVQTLIPFVALIILYSVSFLFKPVVVRISRVLRSEIPSLWAPQEVVRSDGF